MDDPDMFGLFKVNPRKENRVHDSVPGAGSVHEELTECTVS
jgi:hypothetical protein